MRKPVFILFILAMIAGGGGIGCWQVPGEDKTGGKGESIDANRKYLFYLHGAWIEEKGLKAEHPVFGRYRYEEIVEAFTRNNFLVISEPRLERVDIGAYAEKTAERIRDLLGHGVPPENVTVVGHSKGGRIALAVAAILGNPGVNYVILAGCGKEGTMFGKGYRALLGAKGDRIRGRILSLYDSADQVAGSCREVFEASDGIRSSEKVLETGKGHGLFYSPDPAWIDEVVHWSGTGEEP